jgi:hypothetical protein
MPVSCKTIVRVGSAVCVDVGSGVWVAVGGIVAVGSCVWVMTDGIIAFGISIVSSVASAIGVQAEVKATIAIINRMKCLFSFIFPLLPIILFLTLVNIINSFILHNSVLIILLSAWGWGSDPA